MSVHDIVEAETLRFGTGGVPLSSPKRDSIAGIQRLRELKLDCMELEFVQRVGMGPETAAAVRAVAEEMDVALSVHAPYYINFNSGEPEKVEASKERLLAAARVGALCGARNIAFHPAFYHDDPPEVVYKRVKTILMELVDILRTEGVNACLRPETTGKASQFGSLEEILRLSVEIRGVLPCVDFSHLHARSVGAYNRYEEFAALLEQMRAALGPAVLHDMHCHVQGIGYTDKGEQEHLPLEDSDFDYKALLRAFRDYGVKGLVVCESPNLEKDAVKLQRAYRRLAA
ncbi:MAG: TIM barrel protein [Chloroflexi bacterium]|nr:TIM barrel protein [Chloroflexota bacterium]